MKQFFNNNFLALTLLIGLGLNSNAQTQIGQDIDGEVVDDKSGFSVSMPDGNTVAIGAPYNDGSVSNGGHVRIYSRNGNIWSQKGNDINSEFGNALSGCSVNMPDANTVVIGAKGYAGGGMVRVYRWTGVNWVQKGINFIAENTVDLFGYSVCMPDSNTIAIGAPTANNGSGIEQGDVTIYTWNGNAWIQKGSDIEAEATYDYAGYSVSMPDANTVAIGARYNNGNGSDSGHTRVYKWNGSTWMQKGGDIDGQSGYAFTGTSVSMPDSNTIAIGGEYGTVVPAYAGKVCVYRWDGFNWIQCGGNINGATQSDFFGNSVSMPDANTVSVGARGVDGNGVDVGRVSIYKWNGSAWMQIGVDIEGEVANDQLGYSVSMPDVNTLAIGAIGANGNKGRVRVYKLKGVYGIVYNDVNGNCSRGNEMGLADQMAIINPGNIIVNTDSIGRWTVDSLPIGNYTITYNIPSNWQSNCAITQTFTVSNSNEITHAIDFGITSSQPCTQPNVSITATFLRRCFSDQVIYVQACNQNVATGALNAAYVDIELDSLLTPTSSSLPYTNLGNNKYRFELDTINPGQCVNFTINTTVSCTANLQQTLCMEACLFPADSCVFDTIATLALPVGPGTVIPCTLPWDHSSLSVDGYCANDTVYFTINNNGSAVNGNMMCYAPVRVYVDGLMSYTDSIMLGGGQTITYSYPGNGQTWILQADQHPLHPGNSHPNAHVEACGNIANWTPGLVNNLPLDDADPIVDMYCGVVSGAYDPNDKTGFPTGLGTQHEILPNQQLQYLIRFQNTGTDTAFNIVVRDTLDTDLNIFSVVPGVASHNYSFRMYGPRVLEWTFNNIMLPDSNVNEATSHGFLTFTVNQQPNRTDGTTILNDADIYFDFNVPIITNETVHTINKWINAYPIGINTSAAIQKSTIKVFPNPAYEMLNVEIANLQPSNLPTLITIENMLGQVVYTKQTTQQLNQFNISTFVSGVYFIKIVSGGKTEYVKLLKL